MIDFRVIVFYNGSDYVYVSFDGLMYFGFNLEDFILSRKRRCNREFSIIFVLEEYFCVSMLEYYI